MITEDKSVLTEWGGKRGKKGAEDFTYVEEGINSRIYICVCYMFVIYWKELKINISFNSFIMRIAINFNFIFTLFITNQQLT